MLAPGILNVYVRIVLNHDSGDYFEKSDALLLTLRILYDVTV